MDELSWVPDVCTLPTEQRPLRVAEFQALFADALRGLDRSDPTSLRLTFEGAAEVESTVRDLIARESACCSFFEFTVAAGQDTLVVDVRVPVGREPVLDAIARQATAAIRVGNA